MMNSVLTKVRVKELPLLADIGINPDEIGRRQPLVITVELLLSTGAVNGIEDTVDYRRIVKAAESLSLVHIPLIETFAYMLAQKCLSWTHVIEADVSIDKPFAITRGMAGVQVSVRRDQQGLAPDGPA
ncbi:Dihydroneopterin aldolase [Sphingomonas paucimobilis]|uniref:dihydroneopterin aldolase n=1 Tax=Sphingobium sp. DC-2 TaxID=1303256 RepID=UPI0004476010|nr:dihydroneopterin aldolase [Sphingobium sp. DC-2]EZP74417.1 Dihydroneopterin aldolase [Sphingomonas paucimobilis]